MTRLMGDATHDSVPQLAAIAGQLGLVAGYVTGSPDIIWTAADWKLFPAAVPVTIDQGYTGSPVADATVRDVEPGAWSPAGAVELAGWTAPRPTIYCDQWDLSRIGGVLYSGWQGDLWLAIPGWFQGDPLPAAPSCRIVAVQNDFTNPAYDLSIVLDPTWPLPADPKGTDMLIIWGANGPDQKAYLLSGGRISHITDTASLNLYTAAGVQVAGAPGSGITAAEEAALLADFPPGNPSVTVGTVKFPAYLATPQP